MKVQERFNKRAADFVEVTQPNPIVTRDVKLGVVVKLYTVPGIDARSLEIRMTPDEATKLAKDLIHSATNAFRKTISELEQGK